MNNDLVYGFLDESPNLADEKYFFCVDIIVDSQKSSHQLKNIIRKARKRLGKKPKNISELKFNNSEEKTRIFILSEISKSDLGIVVLILDKNGRKIEDNPTNYGIAIGTAICECLLFYPHLNLTVDKKYKIGKCYQKYLETVNKVVKKLSLKNSNLILELPAESENNPGIQIADFVAGAFNAKYNHNNNHYVEILKKKIKAETVTKWTDTKMRAIRP